MTCALTVLMYHYVRPLAGSRYPAIKGLDLALFEGQLDYLERHYRPVDFNTVLAALRDEAELPERAALLTFDDGYSDHYLHAMPVMLRRGWSGVFFPPSCAVIERRMLTVNKVHFVLASTSIDTIVDILDREIDALRSEHDLPSRDELRAAWWQASRFDPAEVIYVKRLLQHALPEVIREDLTSRLFARFVSADEASFADELYMSIDQLRAMIERGMHVGSHGHAHQWLNRLSPAAQTADIERSLDLLEALKLSRRGFAFCYPYGGYDETTLEVLRALGCSAAFTTTVDIAHVSQSNALLLPRLDTNDLPKAGHAPCVDWTQRAEQAKHDDRPN